MKGPLRRALPAEKHTDAVPSSQALSAEKTASAISVRNAAFPEFPVHAPSSFPSGRPSPALPGTETAETLRISRRACRKEDGKRA